MLANTAYRLNKKKKLTVGFLGGSNTEGAGATSWDNTSWRGLVTAELRRTYPEAEIKAVNAAVGGTGSDLALYRLEHDLLKYEPNLVFIEFATNDLALSHKEQYSFYESCLRRILQNDPTTEIVCVFVATKATEEKLLKFGEFSTRVAESVLAYHYGLDMIDPGENFRRAVALSGGDWMKYTTDETHPNDEGYLIYAAAMKKALTRLLAEVPVDLTEKTISAPYMGEENITYGNFVEVRDIIDGVNGWNVIDKPFKKRFPYYVSADGVGSEMNFEFDGSTFGIYWIMDNESGILEVTLDGKETKYISAWDEYCKSFSRAGYVFPFKNVEKGHHTVTLRVSDKKDEQSLGNKISLFAFLFS